MRKIDSNELRQLQLQILDEVASFCEKHNIKYFLMGGTLLGAVRHQGYIPWDDDIDIGMLREDYNRFIELYSSQKNNTYYLYGYEINQDFYFPFIKCCLHNTLSIEKYLPYHKYGVNIDIFPIDVISSLHAHRIIKQISKIRRLHYLKNSPPSPEYYQGFTLLRKRIRFKILSYIPSSLILKNLYTILEQQVKMGGDKKGNIVWGYGEREVVNPDIFDETILMSFEGIMYRVPKKYDEWLTAVYGDYMQLPPVEQRFNHGFEAFYI